MFGVLDSRSMVISPLTSFFAGAPLFPRLLDLNFSFLPLSLIFPPPISCHVCQVTSCSPPSLPIFYFSPWHSHYPRPGFPASILADSTSWILRCAHPAQSVSAFLGLDADVPGYLAIPTLSSWQQQKDSSEGDRRCHQCGASPILYSWGGATWSWALQWVREDPSAPNRETGRSWLRANAAES